jgi:hypothetical protein
MLNARLTRRVPRAQLLPPVRPARVASTLAVKA